ncbi:MAG: ATP-binding cassette domain-containing protein [Burkholderiales bacterium]|nr:ATP-binding cassette domain-containing protein [Burkholderiales bacterium]
MPLLTLEKASLAYGHFALLDGADLVVEPGERVGLIGRNGAGKSSLFSVLSGTAKLDDGRIWHSPGMKLAVVEQEPVLDPENSIFEEVSHGLGNLSRVLLEYHEVIHQLESSPELMEKLHELQSVLEAEDGWSVQSRIETVLSRLDLQADSKISSLSGGQKKRVALARALALQPDMLFLDEPTNHLDFGSIEWLEEFLLSFNGTVFFITHDRRFLDRVATRIVELDRGKLASFQGNFSQYQTKKAELLEIEEMQAQKFDKFLAQEEVWIRKGVEARRTRNEGRVRRLERLRVERASRREALGRVSFSLEEGGKSGKIVAELEHVCKSFGNRKIIEDFSCTIRRGDRIGILGPNGAGKSTLLKLILGELQPDSGNIRLGTKLDIAYFDQLREKLEMNATLADTISKGSDFIEINGEKKHVISYLGDFLFSPERARSPVSSLSGGERNRLLLARLFTRPVNVLVLDEPTNDLDIETLELLESLLLDYSGTIFLVSHDRAFLDNVVTQVIASEGCGKWREYVGGYEDWVRQRPKAVEEKKPREEKKAATQPKSKKSGLSYKENRELEALPKMIADLEQEQKALEERMASSEFYRESPQEIAKVQGRFEEIENALLEALSRWEELEAKKGES